MEKTRLKRKKRQYICPCGKQYFSYPALYTHIKTVHDGKAPGQIQRPEIPSRGRPKLSGALRINQYSRKILESFHDNPILILREIQQQINEQKNSSCCQDIKSILKEKNTYQKLSRIEHQKKKSSFDNQNQKLKNIETGHGLLQFFSEVKSIIKGPLLYEIQLIIIMFIDHIIQESEDVEILETSLLPFIIDFANDFVINGFQPQIRITFNSKRQNKKSNKLVKDAEEQMVESNLSDLWMRSKQNMILTLNILFKWMIYKHYTLTKADMNPNFI